MYDATLARRRLYYAITAALLAAGGTARAAEPSRDGIEEIVVTAQKRAESVQAVPIAITAFSGERLAESGIRTSDELQRFTPNLTWNPAGGAGASVGLRGIVDVNFTTGQVGSVGINVDEVSLNSPVVNTFALFDLERVEVLRGPQVTLYGRSTTGGAINFVTKRPEIGGELNGRVGVTLGRFQQRDVDAALGLPLGERAALRFAAISTDRDGIFENRTLDTDDTDRRRLLGRLSLAAQLTDDVDLYASVHGGRQRGGSYRYKSIGYFDPASGDPCSAPRRVGNGCADASGFVDSGDFDENFSNFPSTVEDIDAYGGLLNVGWSLGAMKFTSITGYENNSFGRNEDTDGGPANLLDVSIVADTHQVSQEFRLASADDAAFKWLAGLYYMRERQDGITTVALRDFDVFISTAYEQTDTIYSAYAQFDVALSERISLTVGGRYSDETKKGTGTGYDAFDDLVGRGIPPIGVLIDTAQAQRFADPALVAVVPFDRSWGNAGGKLGLNFRASDETLVYASVSRGFKGGAINLAAGPVLADPVEAARFAQGVEPEKVTTYEVGAKTQLLDNRMQLNVAAFHNDYTNQQLFIVVDGLVGLLNAGASTINGVELEWQWAPGVGWQLQAGAGYLDASYDELISGGEDLAGNRMLQVPRWSLNATVRRRWDVAFGSVLAEVSGNHVTSQYFDILNTLSSDARTVADARLQVGFGAGEAYKLTLWGKNLGDERFCTNAADLGVSAQCYPNDPRTYGLSFSVDF